MSTSRAETTHTEGRLQDFLDIMPATRHEAAQRLGVSLRTIDRYIAVLKERGISPDSYKMPVAGNRWGIRGPRS